MANKEVAEVLSIDGRDVRITNGEHEGGDEENGSERRGKPH